MGCDIHLMVETKPRNANRWSDAGFFDQFSCRVYGMFARMAKVREYENTYKVQFKPRGIPNDISWFTQRRFFLYTTEEQDAAEWCDNYCLMKDAERWVRQGFSKWVDAEHRMVTRPDYHSHSWLSTNELRQCFDDCFKDENGNLFGDYIEWLGLVSLCEGIESSGTHECRVVFCFDN